MVGVQGSGFLKNSKGLRVWKLTCLSLLLLGQFLLPSQLKRHLLWEAFLIAPGRPKTQF